MSSYGSVQKWRGGYLNDLSGAPFDKPDTLASSVTGVADIADHPRLSASGVRFDNVLIATFIGQLTATGVGNGAALFDAFVPPLSVAPPVPVAQTVALEVGGVNQSIFNMQVDAATGNVELSIIAGGAGRYLINATVVLQL